MKLNFDVFINIADTYHTFYTGLKGLSNKTDTLNSAKLFLNFFDMEYKNGIMKDLSKLHADYECKISKFKITPFKLKETDEEDLCRLISKNAFNMYEIAPLFDCIGYLIYNEEGRCYINFKGNYIYEIWKDFWQYDTLDLKNVTKWQDLNDDFSKYDLKSIDWLK